MQAVVQCGYKRALRITGNGTFSFGVADAIQLIRAAAGDVTVTLADGSALNIGTPDVIGTIFPIQCLGITDIASANFLALKYGTG